jgi:ATP-dependent helicase/nuclease subunit A
MSRPPVDHAARERAATDFERNLGVTAGAGAGKTSLLIERMLEALLVRGVPSDGLVAITFTEKAAAEMRERLLAGLSAVARDTAQDRGDAQGRVRARALARGVPDAATLRRRAGAALDAAPRIGTIHAFALSLLHRHPLEAGVPPEVAIDLGDGFARHVRARLPGLLEAALEKEATRPAAASALQELEIDDLATLLLPLAWLPMAASAPAQPLPLTATLLAGLRAELAAGRTRLPPRPGRAARLYEQWDTILAALDWTLAHPPDGNRRFTLPPERRASIQALPRKLSAAQVEAPGLDLERAREGLKLARRRLERFEALDEPRIRTLLAAVRPWAEALRESFLATGRISADGAIALAVALLRDHPAVRREESARIHHLLVDEFQDTDATQRDLAFFLCEEASGPPARGARQVRLAPGRLFLVGDPKQSIYRFRGADLDVWTETLERLVAQGGATLELETSFRSPPELVAPLNEFFGSWHDSGNDAEPGWRPLVAARPPAAGAGIEWIEVDRGDLETDVAARAEAEGRAIAAEIARWRDEPPPPGAPQRHLRECVILLRGLDRLHCFAGPLRERGIPFTVSGGRTFARRTEVGELATLLLAAADPEDEVAALGALRGSLGALTDDQLLETRQAAGSLRLSALLSARSRLPEGAVALATRLSALRDDLGRRPLAAALARFVEGSPLLPVAAFARDGDQRIANLRKLAGRIEDRSREHALPLAEAVREVMGLDEEVEGESERSLADDEHDAVRILTIHKAKGLEFERVFLPDLTRRQGADRRPALSATRFAGPEGALLAVAMRPRAARAVVNAAHLLREERDRAHRLAEAKRLLYVAMTRARHRLVLVTAKHGDRKGSFAEALSSHLGAGVERREVAMAKGGPATPEPALLSVAEATAAATSWRTAIAGAAAPPPRFLRPSGDPDAAELSAALARTDPAMAADRVPAADRAHAKALGDILHRALAENGTAAVPTPAALARAVAAATSQFTAERRAALATEAQELLFGAAAARLFAALRDVRPIAIELPLTLQHEDAAFRGAADLVFADGDSIVVGDWKSDRIADDDALIERHRPQLAVYRAAVAKAWGIAPPRTELLLLRHGRRLVVDR